MCCVGTDFVHGFWVLVAAIKARSQCCASIGGMTMINARINFPINKDVEKYLKISLARENAA